MYFLLQPLEFVIVLFAHSNERKDVSTDPFKICDKKKLRLNGNLVLAGGTVRWDMSCRFIGYSSQAAKNGIGYRNQRAILR